ncbi:hypothetical protein ACFQH2_06075 [Natronoarchaeum sp. GCM10025703]|uniref:hypothetical protein n=1 Tax=Natronoarchaeum sp. GCM10025703 TaxID=3252685 RepID=UPI00361461AE
MIVGGDNKADGNFDLLTVIGFGANALDTGATAIGYNAQSAMNATAVGREADATNRTTVVGANADAGGNTIGAVAIGQSASVGPNFGVALGEGAAVNHSNSVAVGRESETTADDQVMVENRDIEMTNQKGPVIEDSNGDRYRITVDTKGNLDTEPL